MFTSMGAAESRPPGVARRTSRMITTGGSGGGPGGSLFAGPGASFQTVSGFGHERHQKLEEEEESEQEEEEQVSSEEEDDGKESGNADAGLAAASNLTSLSLSNSHDQNDDDDDDNDLPRHHRRRHRRHQMSSYPDDADDSSLSDVADDDEDYNNQDESSEDDEEEEEEDDGAVEEEEVSESEEEATSRPAPVKRPRHLPIISAFAQQQIELAAAASAKRKKGRGGGRGSSRPPPYAAMAAMKKPRGRPKQQSAAKPKGKIVAAEAKKQSTALPKKKQPKKKSRKKPAPLAPSVVHDMITASRAGDRMAYEFLMGNSNTKKEVYFGTIERCVKRGNDRKHWNWHVLFDDGEPYELNLESMNKAVELYENNKQSDPKYNAAAVPRPPPPDPDPDPDDPPPPKESDDSDHFEEKEHIEEEDEDTESEYDVPKSAKRRGRSATAVTRKPPSRTKKYAPKQPEPAPAPPKRRGRPPKKAAAPAPSPPPPAPAPAPAPKRRGRPRKDAAVSSPPAPAPVAETKTTTATTPPSTTSKGSSSTPRGRPSKVELRAREHYQFGKTDADLLQVRVGDRVAYDLDIGAGDWTEVAGERLQFAAVTKCHVEKGATVANWRWHVQFDNNREASVEFRATEMKRALALYDTWWQKNNTQRFQAEQRNADFFASMHGRRGEAVEQTTTKTPESVPKETKQEKSDSSKPKTRGQQRKLPLSSSRSPPASEPKKPVPKPKAQPGKPVADEPPTPEPKPKPKPAPKRKTLQVPPRPTAGMKMPRNRPQPQQQQPQSRLQPPKPQSQAQPKQPQPQPTQPESPPLPKPAAPQPQGNFRISMAQHAAARIAQHAAAEKPWFPQPSEATTQMGSAVKEPRMTQGGKTPRSSSSVSSPLKRKLPVSAAGARKRPDVGAPPPALATTASGTVGASASAASNGNPTSFQTRPAAAAAAPISTPPAPAPARPAVAAPAIDYTPMVMSRAFDSAYERVMSSLPAHITNQWLQIGFAKWAHRYRPVLFLSPFHVHSYDMREQWMTEFERIKAGDGNYDHMGRLVYWYGAKRLKRFFAMIPRHQCMSYEEADHKGECEIYYSILKRKSKGKKLGAMDLCLNQAWEEMREDVRATTQQRRYRRIPSVDQGGKGLLLRGVPMPQSVLIEAALGMSMPSSLSSQQTSPSSAAAAAVNNNSPPNSGLPQNQALTTSLSVAAGGFANPAAGGFGAMQLPLLRGAAPTAAASMATSLRRQQHDQSGGGSLLGARGVAMQPSQPQLPWNPPPSLMAATALQIQQPVPWSANAELFAAANGVALAPRGFPTQQQQHHQRLQQQQSLYGMFNATDRQTPGQTTQQLD